MSVSFRVALLVVAALFAGLVSAAHAEETTSCLVEGTIIVNKQKVLSKDCFENIGADPEDFKRVCDAMAQTAVAVTKSIGTPPPSVVHGKSCPAGAVAVCKGFLHLAIANHHYKRSAHELDMARESCLTQGGEWK
jgi:hypothetical protein